MRTPPVGARGLGRAMGAWRRLGKAAACAAILCSAARSGASTDVEPIARLSLEGGYDSNALYQGRGSERVGVVAGDLGLGLRDHLWVLRGSYGADFIYYQVRQQGGLWNQRGALSLLARPTRRLGLDGELRASWVNDPIGLAQVGVFVTGPQSALLLDGHFKAEWRTTRLIDSAAKMTERTVLFDDGTGGAMHAPALEVFRRLSPRLSLGGSYALGAFQSFDLGGTSTAVSHGLRARAFYRPWRGFTVDASAGPALWLDARERAIVPEGAVELLGLRRDWLMRVSAAHGLAIGMTARPGLVDSLEVGGERTRIARRFYLRGFGGLWHSGVIPTGDRAVTAYMVMGEAGALLTDQMRMSLSAMHSSRVSDPSPEFRSRTTVGLRLGWELPVR